MCKKRVFDPSVNYQTNGRPGGLSGGTGYASSSDKEWFQSHGHYEQQPYEMMQAKIDMLENLLRSEAEIFARQIYSCPFGVWGKIGYRKARFISTSYQCGSKSTYSHDIIKKMFPDKLGEG